MSDKEILLHLSLLERIGPQIVGRIIAGCSRGHNLSDLYTMGSSEISRNFGLSIAASGIISAGLADRAVLDRELVLCEKHDVSYTTVLCESYPSMLREIHLPPTVLYYKGTPPAQIGDSVAIVGSRKATSYSSKTTNLIVAGLVEAGIAVVSGGAIGADTLAHRMTLQQGGTTVVVLGSGLLRVYPPGNKGLFQEVWQGGGTLLSIFPLSMGPLRGNFPARNRVIAGLSRGVLVTQAAEKSGALITAKYAMEQGREVFAIPGQLGDPLSEGCNSLIQQGAKLVTRSADLLDELGFQGVSSSSDRLFSACCLREEREKPRVVAEISSLTPVEGRIIGLCASPRSTDEIVDNVDLEGDEVRDVLAELQLAGHIEQDFAGFWSSI